MIAGARVEVAPFKEDPMDFVLWKPSDDSLPGWESPWGRGRPGWHIECSAMSLALLGASFDIHGGGIDLQFPHHENEVAQSCCAHPEAEFARVWMHNEMLQVEGKKMSKSLGNFFTVRDLLEKGVPGEVIRFVFLGTHYSKPMDWTLQKAAQAENELVRWATTFANDPEAMEACNYRGAVAKQFVNKRVVVALADNLNTPQAMTVVRELLREIDAARIKHSNGKKIELWLKREFIVTVRLLGFDMRSIVRWYEQLSGSSNELLEQLRVILQERRNTAIHTKDFAPVDAMKAALVAAGVEVRMSKAGVELLPGPGFDAGRLEGLL